MRCFLLLPVLAAAAADDVFTDPAVFERLCHFKNDGVVQHLNPVDEAMIADGACRLTDGRRDGFALWHNSAATQQVIAALKALPPTSKPSHFVLSAKAALPSLCPATPGTEVAATCRGELYETEVMAGAMHNWQRALCADSEDPEWAGEWDPAYQPQQAALTAGFMCILACDCNLAGLPADSLARLAESPDAAGAFRADLCSILPWGELDWSAAAQDVDTLADLAAPIMGICGCDIK